MDSLERLVTQINNGWTRNVPIDFSCEGNELSGVITAVVTGHSGDGEVLVLAEDGHLYLVELPERIGRLSKKACGCTAEKATRMPTPTITSAPTVVTHTRSARFQLWNSPSAIDPPPTRGARPSRRRPCRYRSCSRSTPSLAGSALREWSVTEFGTVHHGTR
jgi:hypothetical protein